MDKLKQQVEECIKSISENGLCRDEVDYLGKLVDIHKDIENECYWKDKIKLKKEESEMRYNEYGRGDYDRRGGYREGYGRRRRDSRGRYMESGYGHYMPEEMMEEMMGEDPFAEFDRLAEEMGGNWEEVPQRNVQKPKHSTPTKIQLAGRVGADQYVMVLNAADQSNITGTAAKVVNGKEQTKYRILGIGSGSDLTVSIYKGKNELVGTLSGTYNGYTYSGTYATESTQTPFQLIAQ